MMLCNTCIRYEDRTCEDCYKCKAMGALGLTPRQWAQIELIGVTESDGVTPIREKRTFCEAISEQLDKELPGLKGFSARNLRNMRTFYEEWSILDQEKLSSKSGSTHVLADASAKTNNDAFLQIWQTRLPNSESFPLADFLHIGFSHHTLILSKVKSYEERIFYIKRVVAEKLSVDALKLSIAEDAFHHQGSLPNNFIRTIFCFLIGS